jgi:hypothetical protein
MLLFPDWDARQRPLFPGDPLYGTGIVPSSAPRNGPKVTVEAPGDPAACQTSRVEPESLAVEPSPGLAKCPDLDGDHCEFIGGLWLEPIFDAEFGR